MSITASQMKDDQGIFFGTLAMVADITVRKDMEKKLEKYSKHLEEIVQQKTRLLAEAQAQIIKSERLTAIGELAGMIGHDLRNPLSGIKNASYH
jgi:signal transduction histidine kinase